MIDDHFITYLQTYARELKDKVLVNNVEIDSGGESQNRDPGNRHFWGDMGSNRNSCCTLFETGNQTR